MNLSTCRVLEEKQSRDGLSSEVLSAFSFCRHLLVSFLLPPLLLASAELLVETQSDRAAHQGHYKSSFTQYLSPVVQNQVTS